MPLKKAQGKAKADMTLYPVLLLPLIAFAMLVFLPLFGNDRNVSKKFRSRKRRKVLLGRLAVFMLLFATFLTLVWPIDGISSLVQGLLITVLVMIPALVLHFLVSIHYGNEVDGFSKWGNDEDGDEKWVDSRSSSQSQSTSTNQAYAGKNADAKSTAKNSQRQHSAAPAQEDDRRQPDQPIHLGQDAEDRRQPNQAIHLGQETDRRQPNQAIPLGQENIPRSSSQAIPLGQDSARQRPNQAIHLSRQSASGRDARADINSRPRTTPEVREQLNQVSNLVQSHDLDYDDAAVDPAIPVVNKPIRELPRSAMSRGFTASESGDLSAMSNERMSGLVTSLREEKGRLQKLVIAQHAVIESERESNIRNRSLARDAIDLMQGAQKNLKVAEKLARRERTERQRIELEYKKVSVALNNAMSIIRTRQNSPNPG